MIGAGDKVVCVDDEVQHPEFMPEYRFPSGMVIKGATYVVESLLVTDNRWYNKSSGRLHLVLVGLPSIHLKADIDTGWPSHLFRKLEDYRNEQELKYRRSQPVQEPEHA